MDDSFEEARETLMRENKDKKTIVKGILIDGIKGLKKIKSQYTELQSKTKQTSIENLRKEFIN